MLRKCGFIVLLIFLATCDGQSIAANGAPNLVLQGVVRSSQHQSYFDVPFDVPAGVHRITVYFHNLGKQQGTVLDLGVADPFRFRGESGGNKDHFTIGEADATPSYLPGAIPAGRWKILLAVPNIRPGVTSRYQAEVYFNRVIDDSSFTESPLSEQPGWYRGDLHMHTAHSDGSCPSETGHPVPCPVFVTVEAAAHRGLDFIAISDHNTMSQYDAMRELQSYFDKTLLIPGREITTFHGHANMFGTTQYVDYRLGTPQVPNVNVIFRNAHRLGAIVSINHPEAPTGEICMGCGWNPDPPVDMSLVSAIEVMNGGGGHGYLPGIRFWQAQLEKGYRPTAVGGSDNHHGDWASTVVGSVGSPTTVVHAQNLSVAAILDGIREGHVFLDMTGSRDKVLELHADSKAGHADMGDELTVTSGEAINLQLHASRCQGATASIVVDGAPSHELPPQAVSTDDRVLHSTWISDGGRHWLRAEVRDASGQLLLLGNPVYINFGSAAGESGNP
jgi:hypothetical protein